MPLRMKWIQCEIRADASWHIDVDSVHPGCEETYAPLFQMGISTQHS